MFGNTVFASYSLLQKCILYYFSLFKKRIQPASNHLLPEAFSEIV